MATATVVIILLGVIVGVHDAAGVRLVPRYKRQTSTLTVRDCKVYPPYHPPTVFESEVRISEIRRQMRSSQYNYQAYIIPGYDAHGSEYAADRDKRIWYMTGFNGTGGVAIITAERGAVWTEKRFELLARQQIACDWEVMVLDDKDSLTPWQWLLREYDLDQQELLAGELRGAGLENGARVGFDPLVMPYSYWYELQETNRLEPRTVNLVATPLPDPQTTLTNQLRYNLVDRTRVEVAGLEGAGTGVVDTGNGNNPRDPYGLEYPGVEIFVHDKELYAGYDWQDKIFRRRQQSVTNPIFYFKNLRELMSEKDADMLVLTKLDEIAWLFNLRGEDIPYNPLFISFAIVGTSYINLYLYDANRRLDTERYEDLREHLELDSSRCRGASAPGTCVSVRDLSSFTEDLKTVHSSDKIWFTNSTNYYVYDTIMTRINSDERHYIMEPSPVLLMKAVKNDVEAAAMREAYIADSVTAIEVAAWMDDILQNMIDPKVGDERSLTEWLVSEKTETFREVQVTYQYPSYETIAAVGPNSADYYYHPVESDYDRTAIPTGKMFLYDIGGQYREGTTTIARTFFFAREKYRDNENENRYNYDRNYVPAEPTDFQKDVYTRVLLGLIDLSNTTFHTEIYGRDLDAIARQHLWDVGLDYFHATGYGVGQYLNAHEGPIYIDLGFTVDEQPFNRSMFVSAGPGYYYRDPNGNRENDFGVRVSNVLEVVPIQTPYTELNEDEDDDVQYLQFQSVSLIPFETRLINFEHFTRKQLTWYNEYNKRILDELGNSLSGTARDWVERRTRFQRYKWDYIGGASTVSMTTTAVIVAACSVIVSIFSL